jgi:hypothetical protein
MPDPDVAVAYQLAYEEAVPGLSQQRSTLDNFRTRPGRISRDGRSP